MPRLPSPSAIDGPGRPPAGNWSFTGLQSPGPGSSAGRPSRRRGAGPGERAGDRRLAGTGAGLLRLMLGLWAVVACRRRGRLVDDPTMVGLLDELRGAIGCRLPVELREVPDLIGPAMAGWRRPVILLPDDWRSWDEPERRAVLAHELAHVVRGDYAAGLLARLAVALNVYHPLVHWIAGSSGCSRSWRPTRSAHSTRGVGPRYLVTLSRLALRQDGRSPCWPARAFLPARGTLIRRISMLRDETRTGSGRPAVVAGASDLGGRVSPRRDHAWRRSAARPEAPRMVVARPEGRDTRRRPVVAAAVFRRRLGRCDRIPSRGGRPSRRAGANPGPLSDLQNAGP